MHVVADRAQNHLIYLQPNCLPCLVATQPTQLSLGHFKTVHFLDAIQGVETELMPTSAAALTLALFGLLYLVYEWMLPQPYSRIPYDRKAARRLLGDASEMLREVGLTREVHVWLFKKVNELQEPLCQVFVQPFSKPWIVLADSVEA